MKEKCKHPSELEMFDGSCFGCEKPIWQRAKIMPNFTDSVKYLNDLLGNKEIWIKLDSYKPEHSIIAKSSINGEQGNRIRIKGGILVGVGNLDDNSMGVISSECLESLSRSPKDYSINIDKIPWNKFIKGEF